MVTWGITIAGLAVTIAIGLIAIRSARKVVTSKITLVEYDLLSPYTELVEVFADLDIIFDGEPISPDVSVYRACVVNTARFDIDERRIKAPLSIRLPSSHKWREAVVTASSPDVNAWCVISSDEELELRWELLKTDESFEFYAVVARRATVEEKADEEISSERLSDKMHFKHRITDLDREVHKERAPRSLKGIQFSDILMILVLGMAIGGIWGGCFSEARAPAIEYYISGTGGEEIQATLAAKGTSSIAVSGDGYREVLDLDSFRERWQVREPVIVPMSQPPWGMIIIACFVTVVGLFISGAEIIEWRRRKRWSKLIVTRKIPHAPKKA